MSFGLLVLRPISTRFFATQRNHRINSCRPPCREAARQHRSTNNVCNQRVNIQQDPRPPNPRHQSTTAHKGSSRKHYQTLIKKWRRRLSRAETLSPSRKSSRGRLTPRAAYPMIGCHKNDLVSSRGQACKLTYFDCHLSINWWRE